MYKLHCTSRMGQKVKYNVSRWHVNTVDTLVTSKFTRTFISLNVVFLRYYPSVSLERWCTHTVVLTWSQKATPFLYICLHRFLLMRYCCCGMWTLFYLHSQWGQSLLLFVPDYIAGNRLGQVYPREELDHRRCLSFWEPIAYNEVWQGSFL